MWLWLAWLAAIASTSVCLFLWFRDVRRIMQEKKSRVESAAGQLAACRERASKAGEEDREAAAVQERSESIYRQAVAIYNQTLRTPWNYLPARLMGFRIIS